MSMRRGNKAKDLIGQTIGPWTIQERAGTWGDSATWWATNAATGERRIMSSRALRANARRAERRANGLSCSRVHVRNVSTIQSVK